MKYNNLIKDLNDMIDKEESELPHDLITLYIRLADLLHITITGESISWDQRTKLAACTRKIRNVLGLSSFIDKVYFIQTGMKDHIIDAINYAKTIGIDIAIDEDCPPFECNRFVIILNDDNTVVLKNTFDYIERKTVINIDGINMCQFIVYTQIACNGTINFLKEKDVEEYKLVRDVDYYKLANE